MALTPIERTETELESEYVEIARRRIESRDSLFTRTAVKELLRHAQPQA